MNRKKLFLCGVLLLMAGATLAPSPLRLSEGRACTHALQGGRQTVLLSGSDTMSLTAVLFAKEFCQAPVVIATGGENVVSVQVGVVTPQIAWLLVYGAPGNEVTVHWQAMEPTQ